MDIRDAMSLAGRTILIVEDEPLVAMSLAEEIEAVDGLVPLDPDGGEAA